MNFLNNNLCLEYRALNEKYDEYLELLFKKTKYFSLEQILEVLSEQIEGWKRQRKNVNLNVFVPLDSESYKLIYFNLKDKLPEHKIINEDSQVNAEEEILILGDFLLSEDNYLTYFSNFNNVIKTGIYFIVGSNLSTLTDVDYLYFGSTIEKDFLLDLEEKFNILGDEKVKEIPSDFIKNKIRESIKNGKGIPGRKQLESYVLSTETPKESKILKFLEHFNNRSKHNYPIFTEYRTDSFKNVYDFCKTIPDYDYTDVDNFFRINDNEED